MISKAVSRLTTPSAVLAGVIVFGCVLVGAALGSLPAGLGVGIALIAGIRWVREPVLGRV